jgi:dolichol-phosphate mannosyltransferase
LYKRFRNSIIESKGFTASLELLLKTVAFGGAVAEVPIFLDYGRKNSASKMRLFSTILGYLTLLFRFKLANNLKHFG